MFNQTISKQIFLFSILSMKLCQDAYLQCKDLKIKYNFQAEESMASLQNDIQSAVNDKVMSAFDPLLDPDDTSLNTKRNEL